MSEKSGTLTRSIAVDALNHILVRRMHSDVALERLFQHHKNALRPLDRAFIFEIVFGSLRWLYKMDWILGHMLNRPLNSLDPRVLCALRVGMYQIYYMDKVPDRAAVSTTVEAVRQVGVPNAASLVNAILRRVAKKGEYFTKPDKETLEYYSIQFSHPQWMVSRWMEHLNCEKLEYLLSHNNQPPRQTLKIITKNALPEGFDDLPTYLLKTHAVESSTRPLKGALRVESLPPFSRCEAFQKGCYMVQDEAAQLCISLLKPGPEDQVLDACAAPGGKSIYLWNEGVLPQNLTVCDVSNRRLKKVHENFQRVGIEGATVSCGDVGELFPKPQFDKVVLDAPCSAMGVIRRHPEIKWQKNLQDIKNSAEIQKKLLHSLACSVKLGGELLYIVCSFEKEETQDQCRAFLACHPQYETVSLGERLPAYYKRFVTRQNELLIYAGNSEDLDGFYAVIFKRKVE